MFVLGIDPGLTRMGYGVVEKSPAGIRAVAVGVIRTDKDQRVSERLLELHRDLTAIIKEHAIDAAAIEQVFSNHNRATATGTGRASGVAMLALAQAQIPVVEYTPSAVKMALTGYGAADKQQVQRVVQMRLGLDAIPKPADAADALAIAVCHVQAAGLQIKLDKAASA
ncbi:MAG: crossover junction endodeoxyribonuclease RuvC [Acidimicrobiia bacterium]|nr:crossover junction endodeoxyribonuclease RuvC [Acidimicrobiia bacterium]